MSRTFSGKQNTYKKLTNLEGTYSPHILIVSRITVCCSSYLYA